ncbi:MAG: RNase adapter RapZ [Clostridia bacterium]|nr:RNase adapter RapZ [Clostridia bacterium]
MNFIIVTGFSGAGKSRAVDALEDIGYYCIDNIPPALIRNFADLCVENGRLSKVAIVTDTRGGDFFEGLYGTLDDLKKLSIDYKLLFLEADDDVLCTRFKETRRKHPLMVESDGSIEKAVQMEREMLIPIRARADFIIDTSLLSPAQLKQRIASMFLENPSQSLTVHCMSFGFKYGPTTEADLMFDVRCLPNPYYVDELRHKTGLDHEVSSYVMDTEEAKGIRNRLLDLIDYLLPLYQKEGKSQLVISVGCTGGKHRSVTFAELIYKHLYQKDIRVTIHHRDIDKK